MTAPMTREELLSRLDERVKAYTSLLGELAWNPKRAHIETAHNLMKDTADVLRGLAQKPASGLKAGEALGLTSSLDRDLAERQIPPTFQDELRALRKLAANPAPAVLPDCGAGEITVPLCESFAAIGFDLSARDLRKFEGALHRRGLNVAPIAAPQPSPRLEREAVEQARFMKLAQYDDTIAKAKDDGALSDTGRDIIVDSCLASKHAVIAFADAILALLSPDTTVVSSTLRGEVGK